MVYELHLHCVHFALFATKGEFNSDEVWAKYKSWDNICEVEGCFVENFGIFKMCRRHFVEFKGVCKWSPKEDGFKCLMRLLEKSRVDYSEVREEDVTKGKVSKIPLRCKKCGWEWRPKIESVVNAGNGCADCGGRVPWTFKRLIERLEKRKELDTSLIKPEHINNGCDSKIPLKCIRCCWYWSPVIDKIVNSRQGCPNCAGCVQWTYERLKDKLKHRDDLDISLIRHVHVNNSRSMLPLKCKKCDWEWFAVVSSVIYMNTGKVPWTYERLMERIKDRKEIDPSFIKPNHVNNGTYSIIPLKCKVCDWKWETTTIGGLFNSNYGCPNCSGSVPWTYDRLMDKLGTRDDVDISLIKPEHINNGYTSKIPLKCIKMNHIWTTTIVSVFNQKRGCPKCNQSRGEKALHTLFTKLDIPYEEQLICSKTTTDPMWKQKSIKLCKWDGVILSDQSKEVTHIIEFDGKGHFQQISKWENCSKRDLAKTEFANKASIPLLRICYKDIDTMEDTVKKFLTTPRNDESFFVSENYMNTLDEGDFECEDYEEWKEYVYTNAKMISQTTIQT
jgi:hypothetical protein